MPVESEKSVDWNIMCEVVSSASIRAWVFVVLLLTLTISVAAPAHADKGLPLLPDAASLAPVPKLLARVEQTFPGRVLKVKLEENAPPTYEVKLLGDDGKVLILYYDAVTLTLERIQGRYPVENDGTADPGAGNGEVEPGDDGKNDDDGRDDDKGDDDSSDDGGGDSGSDDGKDHD